jgi:hypothetical protein
VLEELPFFSFFTFLYNDQNFGIKTWVSKVFWKQKKTKFSKKKKNNSNKHFAQHFRTDRVIGHDGKCLEKAVFQWLNSGFSVAEQWLEWLAGGVAENGPATSQPPWQWLVVGWWLEWLTSGWLNTTNRLA